MNKDILNQFDLSDLKKKRQRRGDRKISERVFDDATNHTLLKLHKKGAFDSIESIISTGKEANVYYGLLDGEGLALKIYCYETSDFKNMVHYIRGDPRFGSWKNRRQLVNLWSQKEYKNLMRIFEKVEVPTPLHNINNVLVMSFIGSDGIPAQKLRDVEKIPHPKRYYKKIIDSIKEMYNKRLVHGDLSEYNILDQKKPVFIDLSAGVLLEHPESDEFLKRDIHNINRFFAKFGVKKTDEETYARVTRK